MSQLVDMSKLDEIHLYIIICLGTISDSNDSQIPNTYIFKLPPLTYSTMASTIFRNDIVTL